MSDKTTLMIACSMLKDKIPESGTLEEKLKFSMAYVRKKGNDLFWMTPRADDDLKFRVAVGGVLVSCSAEEHALISKSIVPLRTLAAAMDGIPVDFSALHLDEGILPLMKWWHESAEQKP